MIWEVVDQVKCYHGYKRNEKPLSFSYHNRRQQIKEVIDCWCEGGIDCRQPVKNYFRVCTTEGYIFLLCYDPHTDSWCGQINRK